MGDLLNDLIGNWLEFWVLVEMRNKTSMIHLCTSILVDFLIHTMIDVYDLHA